MGVALSSVHLDISQLTLMETPITFFMIERNQMLHDIVNPALGAKLVFLDSHTHVHRIFNKENMSRHVDVFI